MMQSSGALTGFKKRRSWLRIVEDILRICLKDCKTTQVVYGSNIAFPRFKKYAVFLLDKGMLEKVEGEDGVVYRTTDRGLRYLKLMGELAELLEESSDEILI